MKTESNNPADVETSSQPENKLIEHERTKLSPLVSVPTANLRNASKPGRKSAKMTRLPYHRVKKKKTESIPKKHNLAVEEDLEEPSDHDKEEEPPKLKADCPKELRCLIQSRWRHRHRHGVDMWDNIQHDLQEDFDRDYNKGVLQMKLRRGRLKYIQWDDKDVSCPLSA